MKYIISLIYSIIIIFPTLCTAENNNWYVKTNVYMEIEEYQDQQDSFNNKVYDKISTIGQLSLNNPTSDWRFLFEHRETLRNHGRNFSMSRDSYTRNRTQFEAIKQFIKSKKSNISVGFRYRKESNDSAPGTTARSANRLYAVTPSGSYNFDDTWSFNYWISYIYYSNYFNTNSYEAETEYGVTYRHSDTISAKLNIYIDKLWDKSFHDRFLQAQIRTYLPIKLSSNWQFTPYLRYYLGEHAYDKNGYLTQKVNNGFRVGADVQYQITPSLALWGGVAYEPTTWNYAKHNKITSGENNKQVLYVGKIGMKYNW
ncbi:OmpG family monomeric porin [Providencia sp. Me31A]|uniref:OmpG family monomeric porin n=1 Tax=Providencia sp. Me31A TaxID=3392637 RepID=UPI003D29496C